MRVILAGQKAFGAEAYAMLIEEGHDVARVWSPPDPDREDALSRLCDRLEWAHPVVRTPEEVARLDIDLFVCAHSHDFISRAAREATKLGGIGYHPSLLPRHRGRDAVEWTVRMGDPVAGGSVYWLTDNVDGGPVAQQAHTLVAPGTTASALWRGKLFPMGLTLLRNALADLDHGVIVEVPQDEASATWEPSIGRPPLHRPDLIQIGAGVPGYEHTTRREMADRWLG